LKLVPNQTSTTSSSISSPTLSSSQVHHRRIPTRKGRVLKKKARIIAGFPTGCNSCIPKIGNI
jgi:hypothetical protein